MQEKTFLKIIDATPLVSIDIIIENHSGEYLLGMRTNRPAKGFWFVPGGRIRKNEKLSQAFQRISNKELGVELHIDKAMSIGAYDHMYTDNFAGIEGVNTHYVALGYIIRTSKKISIQTDEQHSAIKWWSLADILQSDDVHHNTKRYFSSSLFLTHNV